MDLKRILLQVERKEGANITIPFKRGSKADNVTQTMVESHKRPRGLERGPYKKGVVYLAEHGRLL